jgi:hypothetical protein
VYYTGVVATASHGTGNTEATVSDYAVAMKIVQYMPDGSVQEVEYKDPEFYSDSKTSKEEFSAVRCNLGLFGVISEITFRVDDMLSVQVRNDKPRVSEYFPEDYMNTKNDALKELVENVFGVEIFWFPFNGFIKKDFNTADDSLSYLEKLKTEYNPFEDDKLWIKTFHHTDEEPHAINDALQPILQPIKSASDYLRCKLGDIFCGNVGSNVPRITPLMNWAAFKTVPKGVAVEKMPNAIHYQLFIDVIRVRNTEYAFKVDKDFSNVKRAFAIAMDMVKRYHLHDKYPMNICLEGRFVRASKTMLAPCYSSNPNDIFCYIEVLTSIENADWDEFSRSLIKEWMKIPGFVAPHWAKEWPRAFLYMDGNNDLIKKENWKLQRDLVHKAYFSEGRLNAFKKYRSEKDPGNRFTPVYE